MKTKIENFLSELDTEIAVLDYVDIDSIDYDNAFESIYYMIEDNDGFEIEILYHSRAMAYLSENDPSLRESLEIASEYGLDVQDLNSELLATLLASKRAREEFYALEPEITAFFEELNEE